MSLTLSNPKYNKIIKKYNHLEGTQMHNTDTKNLLSIHMKLGTSEFAKIKVGTCPKKVRLLNHLLHKPKWEGL